MPSTQPVFSPSVSPLFWIALTSIQIQKTIRNAINAKAARTIANGAATISAVNTSATANNATCIPIAASTPMPSGFEPRYLGSYRISLFAFVVVLAHRLFQSRNLFQQFLKLYAGQGFQHRR